MKSDIGLRSKSPDPDQKAQVIPATIIVGLPYGHFCVKEADDERYYGYKTMPQATQKTRRFRPLKLIF
jgi:hypothetical protein